MSFLKRLFPPPNIESMMTKDDIKGLVKALGYEKDSNIRGHAANALGRLKDAHAVEPLIVMLRDGHPYPRICAVDALGYIGDIRAIEPLALMLKDNEVLIRQHAADALSKIGDARAMDSLIVALNDNDEDVRAGAAQALIEIADVRAVEPLIASLNDSNVYVRVDAARALGWIGDTRAIKPLIIALSDSSFSDISGYIPLIEDALNKLGWKPDKGDRGPALSILKLVEYRAMIRKKSKQKRIWKPLKTKRDIYEGERVDISEVDESGTHIVGQVVAANNIRQYNREETNWDVVRYILWVSNESSGHICRCDTAQGGTVLVLDTIADQFGKLMSQASAYLPIAQSLVDVKEYKTTVFEDRDRRDAFVKLFWQLNTLHRCAADLSQYKSDYRALSRLYEGEVALVPSDPGKYYPDQLVHLDVFTKTNKPLGSVLEVLTTSASDVCSVWGTSSGHFMIPVIKDIVLAIDIPSRKMIVREEEAQLSC